MDGPQPELQVDNVEEYTLINHQCIVLKTSYRDGVTRGMM